MRYGPLIHPKLFCISFGEQYSSKNLTSLKHWCSESEKPVFSMRLPLICKTGWLSIALGFLDKVHFLRMVLFAPWAQHKAGSLMWAWFGSVLTETNRCLWALCNGSCSALGWWIKPHLKSARLSWRVRRRIMWHSNEDNVLGPNSAYEPRSLFPLPLLCFHVFTLVGEISSHLWPRTEAHTRNACAFHHREMQAFWWNLSVALDSQPFIRAGEIGRKVLAAWETEF